MAGEAPPIPGRSLIGKELEDRRRELADLLSCGKAFPGAQPVSFSQAHLKTLVDKDYFVCEKSDGIRLLMYCTTTDEGREQVLLLDRKLCFYAVPRLHFPLPNDASCKQFHTQTVVDGELVIDTVNGEKKLVYLMFDMLMYRGKDLRKRTLEGRLGYLKEQFLRPVTKFIKANASLLTGSRAAPFSVDFKRMQLGYGITMMYKEVIPNLRHGNDGLIFTSINAPYTSGTDESLLKWKPAEENSVDFLLVVHFVSLPNGEPDFNAIPGFELLAYHGDRDGQEDYRPFAPLHVDSSDWEMVKAEGERHRGLHDKIVECHLDSEQRWRFMRIRDDKTHGNHISIIKKVLESIRDGVTREQLEQNAFHAKKAYKERHQKTDVPVNS
ncbi:putative mRNA capping enzyme alpha subunit [Protomyces lactucae-debilis]|uniref:mRNA-capping enzyme subunit alpha n=1 Tax=Protomyces lactucae-debilis TaxID=2754530 RepID=A0A1Y2FMF1_PROLT|nr:putative mRNA capping enzyme alpha subunit [Protomyces lactucae-debilis]ORY85109.1 putative mRNA capping enzyme alpha subunit [Protomyces lactucae-debilis]